MFCPILVDETQLCLVLMLLEAFAAIYGTIITRLERYLCRLTAFCANCIKHFALTTTLGFAGCTAGFAADRFILEPFLCIELLLAGCENKFRAAILTYQSLVFEHFFLSPFPCTFRLSKYFGSRLTWFFPPHPPTGNLAPKHFRSPLLFLSA